jgi:flagellin-like hook-associated protein FlgL
MIYGSLTGTLHNNLQRLLELETQMATQRKYSKLSDNPSEIARALSLESSINANTQYIRNQQSAGDLLYQTEIALNSVLGDLQTIRTKVGEAGDGVLGPTEVAAIADEIDALKDRILETLNTNVGGKYILGGTKTSTPPFVKDATGQIRYVGSDERIKYEIEQGVLSDVSFTGADVMPSEFQSYFICSHYVGLDWGWTGREEKVQITVGDRTLAVYIPEDWIDEVATGSAKPTDFNQFRDPEELSSISLDDLAALVNRSLVEQGADMLVTATVEKDYDANRQRLVFKSNTGERISVTGWPDTDYLPMAQSIAGLEMDNTTLTAPNYWSQNQLVGSAEPNFSTMTGKSVTVYLNGVPGAVVNLDAFLAAHPDAANQTAKNLAAWMNNTSGALPTGVIAGAVNGKIAFTAPPGGKIHLDGTGATSVAGTTQVSEPPEYQGLMGTVNTLGWKGDGLGKEITIAAGGVTETFKLDGFKSITELAQAINAKMPTDAGDADFASIVAGRLVLQSTRGQIEVKDAGAPATGGGTMQLFGYDGASPASLKSSSSSLSVSLDGAYPIKIYVNEGDTLKALAERVNAIEGITARTSADGDQLVVVAQRAGALPEDPLAVDTVTENLHYPSFTLWGEGMAMSLFDFDYAVDADTDIESGAVSSKEQTRQTDHSHMDVFDYLSMETALKSREYEQGEIITVATDTELHWRIMSGSHTTEIKILSGEYTLAQLAERLQNAGAGWLEVDIDVLRGTGVPGPDDDEYGLGTSANAEAATSRLVIRGADGSPVVFMDMNEQRYAEAIGLSTALRSDEKMGMANIVLPTAPCLDDNLAAAVRVQMTCGRTFDVRLARGDVEIVNPNYDPANPTQDPQKILDRVKVMEQIARQVNAQAGFEVMKVVVPVDGHGQKLSNSASLAAVTGEPFEVVDLPVLDPNWSASYTAGVAAQMGIHGGVTSNLKLASIKDNTKMEAKGTIRFESLGRSVEIDVTADDTAKTVMDRLRSQAGDWLYVNYFDAEMGNSAGQEEDYPILAIAAKDGSAVNVIDVKGTVAEEKLLLSTGIQGKVNVASWSIAAGSQPPQTFSITVAGYTHAIDLTAMRDINGNNHMDAEDLVAEINARMQDYDVKAELNDEGKLVLWSPRGYAIKVEAKKLSTVTGDADIDITNTFLGTGAASNSYRGGYGLDKPDLRKEYSGVYAQNVVTRSGANQTKQSFFGVLDDISAAVRAENRDGLFNKLAPKIDKAIDTLLRIMSTGGALQSRYENNVARMEYRGLSMTESHDKLVGIDLAEMSTELMMAQSVYQASLGVIGYIVQPTLLDFLR